MYFNVEVRVSIGMSFFLFKQKTAYEVRISDWSSDVCSSDLRQVAEQRMERVHHAEIERNPGRIEERQHAGTAEEVPQDRDVLQGLAAPSLALQDSVHHAREGRGGQLLLYPARNPDERSAPHGVEHGEKQDRKRTRLNSSH